VLKLAERVAPVRVTIAGSGLMLDDAMALSRRLASLHVLGYRDRGVVLDKLARARVAVCPSRWPEPAGSAALEAMAVGTPVVTYDRAG
jgi:glycosyltransferase involved in cell wall biosynthesis